MKDEIKVVCTEWDFDNILAPIWDKMAYEWNSGNVKYFKPRFDGQPTTLKVIPDRKKVYTTFGEESCGYTTIEYLSELIASQPDNTELTEMKETVKELESKVSDLKKQIKAMEAK